MKGWRRRRREGGRERREGGTMASPPAFGVRWGYASSSELSRIHTRTDARPGPYCFEEGFIFGMLGHWLSPFRLVGRFLDFCAGLRYAMVGDSSVWSHTHHVLGQELPCHRFSGSFRENISLLDPLFSSLHVLLSRTHDLMSPCPFPFNRMPSSQASTATSFPDRHPCNT